ncbi:hypothetical protein Oter_2224 [Opitutus terrae PB90-1]|uniref:Uncharacterized protein n=2 Tax=Opitutus terrae TaxID=107709 RepID=B1ZPQ4_OPITP|nr:hypothetical protein Oter_2224 [Opitutus terrae PB90-1]
MGYILLLILLVAVVAVLLMAFMGGKKRPVGRAKPGDDVTPKQPAANEATPHASDLASNRVADQAQQRTPPA